MQRFFGIFLLLAFLSLNAVAKEDKGGSDAKAVDDKKDRDDGGAKKEDDKAKNKKEYDCEGKDAETPECVERAAAAAAVAAANSASHHTLGVAAFVLGAGGGMMF
ncbi:hypothetical protein THAOC_00079 [Thalassiosira oceanica]|uniref:Uncharacterized protein n=1 Tax=Thalassiosira oceanica TaxID=159749 RepID=K0SQN9_THAOC|nr:hypothetical protein THAOC_11268 [Thalassiosira oceanica]EJK78042.1 hypothetical protein THAOC_00079 [Thalassiosira oceanica]|mmetsp:Transcript_22192/g.52440  ORF Transcript_22192/g.52440 Transcript_22192/m.52440 type:complete len:105 (-) Transcript_22192:126-440(-)|eukprot:EJK67670.1 hypothetical protein THAOC_11268 [Thalassiosira oceanica]